jgi:hypothetical protein
MHAAKDTSTMPYALMVCTEQIHIFAFTFNEEKTAFFAGVKMFMFYLAMFSLCQ